MGDPHGSRTAAAASTTAVVALPRRLEFVRPRLLSNGLIHAEPKAVAVAPATKANRPPVDTRWAKTFGAASGLHNLGNTCFLNSILQCITHTPPLANVLLARGSSSSSCSSSSFCFLCFLKGHVPMALKGGAARSPRSLVANLGRLSRSFRPGRQHDAHEFLCKCLEALQRSCQPSLVDAVFGGRFRSRVRCRTCAATSDAYDPFQDIALDIVRAGSIHAALQHFTAPELLTGPNRYECGACRQRVVADKRLTIDMAPPALTIQLKRFTYTGSKIAKPVQYGHRLDLGPFLSDPPARGQHAGGVVYSLFGLVVHLGSGPRSGHYVAYVKSAAGPWYMMDDASVSKIGADAVLEQKPYLLFYVRDPPPPPPPTIVAKSLKVLEEALFNSDDVEKGQQRPQDQVVPEPIAVSVSGGDTIPNEIAGGDRIDVDDDNDDDDDHDDQYMDMALPARRPPPLPKHWRYHRLRQSCLPIGQVVMRTLKTFKTVQPVSFSAWDDDGDRMGRMRILREHRDQATIGHRSEYDRDYDRGRVRKVKKTRGRDLDQGNRFQDIVNKRIRHSS